LKLETTTEDEELTGDLEPVDYAYFPQFIHWSDCGLSTEWYEKQKKILEYDPRKINQELE
jgi:hypothetical protein